MKRSWTLSLMLVATALGCRTVWIHPDASQAKFDADRAECQRAIDEARAAGASAPNWKRCLLDRGWTATTDFRSSAAVRKPLAPTSERIGPGARR